MNIGSFEIKNVSCISLAGWFLGKFKAVKLYQSFSISGPSSILKPISLKILIILFLTILRGWRAPIVSSCGGRVKSILFDPLAVFFFDVCDKFINIYQINYEYIN